MRFQLLGPVCVTHDGQEVPLGPSKQRALLAALLLDAGRVVSVERLTEALWEDAPPSSAVSAQLVLARRRTNMTLAVTPHMRRQLFYTTLLIDGRAAKEIRLFGIGGFLRDRMLAELAVSQAGERSVDRAALRIDVVWALLSAAVSGAALAVEIGRIAGGTGSTGDLTVLIAAITGLQGGVATIVIQAGTGHQMLVMFGHYLHVARPGASAIGPGTSTPPLHTGIELHDVWFRYHPDHDWVLRGISLTLHAGSTLALVGLNGSGKSTLVKLLCRMYEPDRGSITWDGIDVRELDHATLRRRIAAVFQDYMTYEMPAADNIAIGDLAALNDPARLRAAAAHAGLDAMIEALPRGYDTILGRSFTSQDRAVASAGTKASPGSAVGVVLSGGQWQRMAIARAAVRTDVDLLILDEPSSGLDAVAERSVHERMRGLHGDRAVMLISHRLNAVRGADQIVVLSGGRITERGTHASLIALEGAYAELFRTQASGYETQSHSAARRCVPPPACVDAPADQAVVTSGGY